MLKILDIVMRETKVPLATRRIFLKAFFFLLPVVATAQVDTTLKEFFPMSVGNYWEYELGDGTRWYRKILGDTVLPNGKQYAVILQQELEPNPSLGGYYFYRIDDSLQVILYRGHIECEESIEFKLNVQDSTFWFLCDDSTSPRACLESSERYQPIVGALLTTRLYCWGFYDPITQVLWCAVEHFLARGFGIVESYFEASGSAYLVGAIIDGTQYGRITSVGEGMTNRTMPKTALLQNYPNPFNPLTTISYELESSDHIRLSIYNVLGQEIKLLVDEEQEAGRYQISWGGSDRTGTKVSGGPYIYRLTGRTFEYTGKLMLLR